MVYTVIFEVDIKNNQILFFHTGSLSVKPVSYTHLSGKNVKYLGRRKMAA